MRVVATRGRKVGILPLVGAAFVGLVLSGCAAIIVDGAPGADKVRVCHKGKKTLEVGEAAFEAHLKHGDSPGVCR